MAKTSLNGFDTAGTFAERPRDADTGCSFFATDYRRSFTYLNNNQIKVWVPDDRKVFYDEPEKYFVDGFAGSAISNAYESDEGTDGLTAITLDTNQMGGELDMVTGEAGTGTGDDGVGIQVKDVLFDLSSGTTRMGCRVKLSAIADVAMFFGLSDLEIVSGAGDPVFPVTISGTTFTDNATNFRGILFDTAATEDIFYLTSRANGTISSDYCSASPVGNTYADLVIVTTVEGESNLYVDGVLVGTIEQAPAVIAMWLSLQAVTRSAESQTLSTSLFFCHQDG